jgi:hypothetical protein
VSRDEARKRALKAAKLARLGEITRRHDDASWTDATIRAVAEAYERAMAAAGYVVVPTKPTIDMLVAGTEAWLVVRATEDRAEPIWAAMLEAAMLAEGKDD